MKLSLSEISTVDADVRRGRGRRTPPPGLDGIGIWEFKLSQDDD